MFLDYENSSGNSTLLETAIFEKPKFFTPDHRHQHKDYITSHTPNKC